MAILHKAYRDANGEIVYVVESSIADLNIGPLTRVPALDRVTSNDELTDESVVPAHTHVASEITDFNTAVAANTDVAANTAKRSYPVADETKLAGIEAGATADQNADEVPLDNTGSNLTANQVRAALLELDARTSPGGSLLHSSLAGLNADDHLQYHTDARGDARYYTKVQLDAGQLDTRYYTEAELDGGQLDNRYFTEAELLTGGALDSRYFTQTALNSGVLDARYYTETELNSGQLDNRYYTETELNSGVLNGLYYTQAAADALLNAKINVSSIDQPLGVAGLDAGGKLSTAVIPALAISEPFVVADIPARDALTIGSGDGEVQKGDLAIVTDASADPQIVSGGATYIYDGAAWQRLITPTDLVISVNGFTGAVVLTTTDIAEGTNLYYTDARVSANVDVAANTTHRGIISGNPHQVTLTEAVAADSGTDVSAGELETLTDGSDAAALHNHDSQYFTQAQLNAGQLDNQYYTETELDAGQLDNRYYTESELDGGQLDNRYYTEAELLTGGVLDSRYYTETELDTGQLDNRYYTETEVDNFLALKVTGPASAVDNNIALFDGTTGKLIKDTGFSIIDEDDMVSDSALAVPTQQSVKAFVDRDHRHVVNQPGHGFTLSNNVPLPARMNGATVELAQADDINTLSAFYITEVIDTDNFVIQQSGRIVATSHGLTTGQYYYLSETTAGAITSIEPLNSINDVVFYVVDADTLLMIDNRPVDNESLQKYLIKISNTDTTTNINQTTFTAVPLNGTVEVNENSYYTPSGDGIQIDTTRSYTLTVNVHYTSTGARAALQGRFYVNGAPVGAITSTGYIRSSNGHNEASLHLTEKFSLTAGDLVEFRVQRESTIGTAATMPIAGSSNMTIEAR